MPVMMRGQQHIVTIQVGQRNIRRVALLRMDQDELCFRLSLRQLQHFLELHAIPMIIKSAPSRDAVEIAVTVKARAGRQTPSTSA